MAGALQKAKSGKKQRKFGRNALFCKSYKEQHRGEQNQLKRIVRHLRRQHVAAVADAPADIQAAVGKITAILPVSTGKALLARLAV